LLIPFNLPNDHAQIQVKVPNNNYVIKSSSSQHLIENPKEIETPQFKRKSIQTTSQSEENAKMTLTQTKTISLVEVAFIVWLIGFLFFSLYQLTSYLIFKKKIFNNVNPIYNSDLNILLESITKELKIKKKITVVQTNEVDSPLMTGFFKPILIMPIIDFDRFELDFILKHELTHLKRNDIWYKLLLLIVKTIHWFNPFVWMLAKEANLVLELSCDETTVEGKSINERKLYSEVLLNMVNGKQLRGSMLSTNFSGKGIIMKRLLNILVTHKKKKGFLIIAILGVLLLASGTVFSLSLYKNADSQKSSIEETKNVQKETSDSLDKLKKEDTETESTEKTDTDSPTQETSTEKDSDKQSNVAPAQNTDGSQAGTQSEPQTETHKAPKLALTNESGEVLLENCFKVSLDELMYQFGNVLSSGYVAGGSSTPDKNYYEFEKLPGVRFYFPTFNVSHCIGIDNIGSTISQYRGIKIGQKITDANQFLGFATMGEKVFSALYSDTVNGYPFYVKNEFLAEERKTLDSPYIDNYGILQADKNDVIKHFNISFIH
jgi:beta-lactamase regulating signal transducer with metallopeptidase domain